MWNTTAQGAPRGAGSIAIRSGALIAVVITALAACGSSGGASAGASIAPSTASGGSSTGSSSNTPIKIGNVGNYSGFAADTIKSASLALTAWSKTVNASGGIDGHPVEVIVKDSAGSSAQALSAVKDLIANDHVVALVANAEAGLESVWAKYADEQKVPVIGEALTVPPTDSDPNFFPVSATSAGIVQTIVSAAKLLKAQKLSTVYCAETPSCALTDGELRKASGQLGIGYVQGQPISASATSYVAQCTKLKDEGADAVFLSTALTTAERLIQECSSNGYHPKYLDVPENWTASAATAVGSGFVFTGDAPLWFGNGPGTADFLAAMSKYSPGTDLDSTATVGWYSGEVFQSALTAALKSDPSAPVTAQTVYDGLYELGPKFDLGGIIAPVTYSKDKAAVQQACGWYGELVNGALTTPYGANRICS
jgi:branched-chain amino acid transport system substrate-binding protein